MHFWTGMGHSMQLKLLWGFYTNTMSIISNGYESTCLLQSHMFPCNFGKSPVFWNPVPIEQGSVSRMCADPCVTIPCFDLPNFRSEPSSVELWVVELAYRPCFTNARNPDVNSSTVFQRQYRTFDVIKSITIDCVRAQHDVRRSKYNSRGRNGFTEQENHEAATVQSRV